MQIDLNRKQSGTERSAQLLNEARTSATLRVNEVSRTVRSKYVSAIPGQDMVYTAKRDEAKACLLDAQTGTPDPLDYPFLASEVGTTGDNICQIADIVLFKEAMWRQLGAALEGIRIKANADIQAAATEEEIAAALSEFETAMLSF